MRKESRIKKIVPAAIAAGIILTSGVTAYAEEGPDPAVEGGKDVSESQALSDEDENEEQEKETDAQTDDDTEDTDEQEETSARIDSAEPSDADDMWKPTEKDGAEGQMKEEIIESQQQSEDENQSEEPESGENEQESEKGEQAESSEQSEISEAANGGTGYVAMMTENDSLFGNEESYVEVGSDDLKQTEEERSDDGELPAMSDEESADLVGDNSASKAEELWGKTQSDVGSAVKIGGVEFKITEITDNADVEETDGNTTKVTKSKAFVLTAEPTEWQADNLGTNNNGEDELLEMLNAGEAGRWTKNGSTYTDNSTGITYKVEPRLNTTDSFDSEDGNYDLTGRSNTQTQWVFTVEQTTTTVTEAVAKKNAVDSASDIKSGTDSVTNETDYADSKENTISVAEALKAQNGDAKVEKDESGNIKTIINGTKTYTFTYSEQNVTEEEFDAMTTAQLYELLDSSKFDLKTDAAGNEYITEKGKEAKLEFEYVEGQLKRKTVHVEMVDKDGNKRKVNVEAFQVTSAEEAAKKAESTSADQALGNALTSGKTGMLPERTKDGGEIVKCVTSTEDNGAVTKTFTYTNGTNVQSCTVTQVPEGSESRTSKWSLTVGDNTYTFDVVAGAATDETWGYVWKGDYDGNDSKKYEKVTLPAESTVTDDIKELVEKETGKDIKSMIVGSKISTATATVTCTDTSFTSYSAKGTGQQDWITCYTLDYYTATGDAETIICTGSLTYKYADEPEINTDSIVEETITNRQVKARLVPVHDGRNDDDDDSDDDDDKEIILIVDDETAVTPSPEAETPAEPAPAEPAAVDAEPAAETLATPAPAPAPAGAKHAAPARPALPQTGAPVFECAALAAAGLALSLGSLFGKGKHERK